MVLGWKVSQGRATFREKELANLVKMKRICIKYDELEGAKESGLHQMLRRRSIPGVWAAVT